MLITLISSLECYTPAHTTIPVNVNFNTLLFYAVCLEVAFCQLFYTNIHRVSKKHPLILLAIS